MGSDSVRPFSTLTGRGNLNVTCVAASVASIWSTAPATAAGAAMTAPDAIRCC
jgi:hypothetical protein